MTQFSYDRVYELAVTELKEVERDIPTVANLVLDHNSSIYKPRNGYRTVERFTKIFTDLNISVDISANNKSSGSSGQFTTLKIYNLNKDTRSMVVKENNNINLRAGYRQDGDNLPVLFSGQVVSGSTKKEGQDVITTLHCKSGHTPMNSVLISATVNKGSTTNPATYADVYEKLIGFWNDNGIALGSAVLDQEVRHLTLSPENLAPAFVPLERDWVYSGKLRQAMDDLGRQFNYTWNIVNNNLYIYPKYYRDMIREVTVNESNIISIDDRQDGGKIPSSSSEARGIEVKLLLNGRIDNTHRLTILDGDKKGSYRISEVAHSLDYEGDAWFTKVKCDGGD